MKPSGHKLYLLLLAVGLVAVFLYHYHTPEEFVWQPTFDKYDRQPFGSYVFDDVLSSSIEGYRVVNQTFYQLCLEAGYAVALPGEIENILGEVTVEEVAAASRSEEEEPEDAEAERFPDEPGEWEGPAIEPLSPEERRSILVTENYIDFSETDLEALQLLLQMGHKVMLCLTSFEGALCDTFGITETYQSFPYAWAVERYAKEGFRRDSLFLGVDSLHPEKVYTVFPHMHPTVLEAGIKSRFREDTEDSLQGSHLRCDSFQVLVRNDKGEAVALRLFTGEGELFLVGTPLMFTNYGLLDGNNASYAFRLLSHLKDYPVLRTEAYSPNHARSESPLRYLLSQPPLRWALYVALVTILLYMFFATRRRQWVIPIVRPPANETLRFTQLIGNLYYQRKDFKDLLCKKYLYFCNEVKQLSGFDLQSGEPDREISARLAEKTGQDDRQFWPAFRELKYHLREQTPVNEEEMMRHIDRMNKWKQLITNGGE
ncbi:MAG: hypothetical protein LBP98_09085 [Tannerella sp.]|jgi:hypothetical protein|nr:hypothetical protein [Tannerella sp.]